jgi:hypothetical protein
MMAPHGVSETRKPSDDDTIPKKMQSWLLTDFDHPFAPVLALQQAD